VQSEGRIWAPLDGRIPRLHGCSAHFTQHEIYRSLRTTSRHDAITRSQAFGIATVLFFRRLRAMANEKNDKLSQADFANTQYQLRALPKGITMKYAVIPKETCHANDTHQ
jgi:hypothetical protein